MQRKLIALLLAAVLLLSLSAAADTLDALDSSEALTLQVDSAAFTPLNASGAGTDVLNAFAGSKEFLETCISIGIEVGPDIE